MTVCLLGHWMNEEDLGLEHIQKLLRSKSRAQTVVWGDMITKQ